MSFQHNIYFLNLVLLFVITVTYLRMGAAWGHAAYKVVGRVTDPALMSPYL